MHKDNKKEQQKARKREYDKNQYWYNKRKDNVQFMQDLNRKRRDYYRKLRNAVFNYYGWICKCCGETGKSFLTIDHKNNNGAAERKNGLKEKSLLRHIIKSAFPDTYQILCMNCNFSKKINGGTCEHQLLSPAKDYNQLPQ